jgi:hypothetical protein
MRPRRGNRAFHSGGESEEAPGDGGGGKAEGEADQRRSLREACRIVRPTMAPLAAAGSARPSSPVSVFAEDFSLLIRSPRRFRLVRGLIRVLS